MLLKVYYPFILWTFMILSTIALSGEINIDSKNDKFYEDGTPVLQRYGLYYCQCFGHCLCKHNIFYDEKWHFFPDRPSRHVLKPMDRIWHTFMKEMIEAKCSSNLLVYPELDPAGIDREIQYNIRRDDYYAVHFLSDYLFLIDQFKRNIIQERHKSIALYHELYSAPKEKLKLEEHVNRTEEGYTHAMQILNELPEKITYLYRQALNDCRHISTGCSYHKGLLYSLEGDWEKAIKEMQELIRFMEERKSFIGSQVYIACGEAYLEVNLFHEAIEALTKAIQKDSKNKQAYFYRASAYFENGNFDLAIDDYLMSDRTEIAHASTLTSKEFTKALCASLCQGAAESAIDFVPSFCITTYGLGKTLWATAKDPVESTKVFSSVCYEMGKCFVDYCKTVDSDTIDGYINELKELYNHFERLNDSEKGQLIGHAIGKYGVDIFAGGFVVGGAIKGGKVLINGASVYRKLKNVNRAYNLEAMAASSANKEKIVAESLKHASEREAFFKNVTIEIDKQNKHIVGKHNFELGKSEFVHSDPQNLLSKFAGKGKPINNKTPGMPDYRERVDFEEIIGYYVNEENAGIKLPTTKGTIRYSKKGAHIIPSHPDGK